MSYSSDCGLSLLGPAFDVTARPSMLKSIRFYPSLTECLQGWDRCLTRHPPEPCLAPSHFQSTSGTALPGFVTPPKMSQIHLTIPPLIASVAPRTFAQPTSNYLASSSSKQLHPPNSTFHRISLFQSARESTPSSRLACTFKDIVTTSCNATNGNRGHRNPGRRFSRTQLRNSFEAGAPNPTALA